MEEPGPTLVMFALARDASGRTHDRFDAGTLDGLLDEAVERYGDRFGAVLDASRVWVNGAQAARGAAVELSDHDDVAVIPPVAGG
ncbi:MoaD/ThiS family protein [Aeromicrobium sp.]|uniref:MoaD/ThiS family protein n=2 Tax=Aeromicrobium sp. TaxID=1871063 RepID=UPI003519B04A